MLFHGPSSTAHVFSWYKVFVVFDGIQQTELTFGQRARGAFGKDPLGLGIFETITILLVDFSDGVWHVCLYRNPIEKSREDIL